MAVKFVVAHRMDPNNVGDIASNPLQYFLNRDEYEIIDVANIGEIPYKENVPLIVGGGGLIGNEFIGNDYLSELIGSPDRSQLERMWQDSWTLCNTEYKSTYDDFYKKYQALMYETLEKIKPVNKPRFVWGAGHNGDEEISFEKIKWPKALSKYKLVGLRDYHSSSRFQWVPCASCMHPAFDRKYIVKNDVIWFEHKKQMIKDFGQDPIPRFINTGNNMDQTIELLGSANIILTNSYHGAYWGSLLKKRVIIVGGSWSSKFKFIKHAPIILDKREDWKGFRDTAPVWENALEECRQANKNFWEQIKDSL
jgi:hypothetical protein